MRRVLGVALTLSGVICVSACGPNPYDLYLKAMRAQGAAERGTCKLKFDSRRRSHTINSGQITRCIRDMDEVLDMYEKARAAGYEGQELERAKLKINEDLRKLRSMKGMVSEMEEVN